MAGGASAPLLVDSREVARLLGIGRTKTFQLMASGELPMIRLGRCVRVPVVALQSWIAAQTSSVDA
jgi:excisionase family DNA binding protein